MATRDLLDDWHHLHAQQTDWTYRAYDRLISSLSEDVQEKLGRKDHALESFVVIFGRTQVGKTTLLLDLMGVAEGHMGTVSTVLRGGREAGKSATATAMEYTRSTDDRWGLAGNDRDKSVQWFDADEAITHSLGDLRAKMEAGLLQTDSPCVVHIPQRMFKAAPGVSPSVRMLDLPGDSPANATEQQHVHAMAKTYIPFADLVILVGRGDDLGFLRPDALTLPGIRDWQKMPHRFRVVTTYSYTAKSVRDFIRTDPQFDAAALRQRLVQEIERFGTLSKAAAQSNMYFPLEFGTSWMDVKAHDPVLHSRMAPLIGALRTELLEHIVNSTSPMGRLRNTLNTHLAIKAIQEEKRDVIRESRCALRKHKRLLALELDIWDKGIKETARKRDTIAAIRAANPVEANKRMISATKTQQNATVAPLPDCGEIDLATTVKDLQALIRAYKHALRNIRLAPETQTCGSMAYWKMVKKELLEPEAGDLGQLADRAFADIQSRLDTYWIDSYFSLAQFRTDRRAVVDAGLGGEGAVRQCLANAWYAALAEVERQLQDDLNAARSRLTLLGIERDAVDKEHQANSKRIDRANAELREVRQEAEQDLVRCAKFFHLLDEEYLAALNAKLDSALVADDDCDALLQIFACEDMRRQRRDVLNMNAEQGETTHAIAD